MFGRLRSRRTLGIAAVFIALLLGGLGGSWLTARTGRSPFGKAEVVPMWISSAAGADISKNVSFVNGFVPVVKKILPAVVNIASSKIIRSPNKGPMAPFFSDPFFQQFFGDEFSRQFRIPQEQRERSLGSGVLVSPDGYILTNNHVVEGASDIKISLADKREFEAHIVGTDSKTDVAVLKIEAKNLPVMTFGDSSKMQVGDFALAVGNPFGVGETVTMGIISATGRGGLGIEDYEDFIQTDAAINPGNSGGALVNVGGELIGLNAAIISGGGGNQGVGFAVPVNMARNVMEEILKHGKVTRGWLGISIQTLTPAMAKAFGQTGQVRGALVTDVTPDSPAARSGLQRGDIVLEMNGEPVTDSRALSLKIATLAPGTTVRLKVSRDGRDRDISVTLGELPSKKSRTEETGGGAGAGPRFGISVEPLTPQLARQLGLSPQTTGVVIDDIQPGSAAEEAGLHRGDVIQSVNHKPVKSVDELQSALRQAGNEPALLLIDRGGNHLFIVVEPQ
jgi:serine protease Do